MDIKDKENFGCIMKDGRPICATEINSQGVLNKYGFCDKFKGCKSDIKASTIDSFGVDQSKNPDVMAGDCCFPFVDATSKGRKINYKSCAPGPRGNGVPPQQKKKVENQRIL